MSTENPFKRSIKSFVCRAGRVTVRQQQALAQLTDEYVFSPEKTMIDYPILFGRKAPVVLEIGFGMGESLAKMAKAQPDRDFIGVEVHVPGVGGLLARLQEDNLRNVRVIIQDAKEVLEYCIADASLAGIQIYFPDPWPKKRHWKRRLIEPEFVNLLAQKIQPTGFLHLATDWEPYAQQMLSVLSSNPLFRNCGDPSTGFLLDASRRPETKFERRGRRLGHGVWDLLFERA